MRERRGGRLGAAGRWRPLLPGPAASPRSLVDCLIAAVAIGARTPVLHADGDFTMIARLSRLKSVTG